MEEISEVTAESVNEKPGCRTTLLVNSSRLPLQKGIVVWLYGLSGAGKSTISALLKKKLEQLGYLTMTLDGDVLRTGINKDLSFSKGDRHENIRRAAEISKIMVLNNIITICSFITPLEEHRSLAREVIGEAYLEVFIDCPIEVCQQRDVKGLYEKARLNHIQNFTGVSADFESSNKAALHLETHLESEEASTEKLFKKVLPLVQIN
jgi:adenylylsulfate kinase